MPSALTGNTSGLASATSPGLVGITTQTFAGVKTFQSGANIATQGTGVATASGYLGYSQLSTSTSVLAQSSPTSGTLYFPTGMTSLSLTAGNYILNFFVLIQVSGTFTALNFPYVKARILNSTDSATLANYASGPLQGPTTETGNGLSGSLAISLTATKTIQLQIGWAVFSGAPTVATLNARGDLAQTYLQSILIG